MYKIENYLMLFLPVDAVVLLDSTNGAEQLRVSLHTRSGL
jgi:hypothetical protein